ncbi:DinB family protein [Bacillus sp. AK128]
MLTLFKYNWQVRNEWFDWCDLLSSEELLRPRKGGVGNILHTLIHVIDVEYSWIRGIKDLPDVEIPFKHYETVDEVKKLCIELHKEVRDFVEGWSSEMEDQLIKVNWSHETYTKGEILRHIIAHEIHHIGQLSVWARELGLQPVSANLIGRKYV